VKRILLILLVIIVIYSIAMLLCRPFLAINRPVKSSAIVIEAWISPHDVELALPLMTSDSIKKIFIVGQNYPGTIEEMLARIQSHFTNIPSDPSDTNGIWLLTNSALAFNCLNFSRINSDDTLKISVRAKGSSALGLPAHFNLVLNGQLAGSTFVESQYKEYQFQIQFPEGGLQSLIIFFDNDVFEGKKEDRNLNISSLRINGTQMNAGVGNTQILLEYSSYTNGFNSQPAEMQNYLVQLGVDPLKIQCIAFHPVNENQTLAASQAFKQFPQANDISSFNILSSGLHSRRTWLTYQRVLGMQADIGIINYEPNRRIKGKRSNLLSGFFYLNNEAFSYLFNWIYLTLIQ
jgi:hypothetical protein